MNRKIRNVFSLVLLLVLLAVTLSVTVKPVPAKDMNLPPGAGKIYYYSEGNASIGLPAGLPNYPTSATKISFSAFSSDGGTFGPGFNFLVIQLYMKTSSNPNLHWEPIAVITTSSEDANFEKIFWSGTYVIIDAALYPPLPPSYSTNNVKLVDQGDLTVERDGNNIYVNLAKQQSIQLFSYPKSTPFILPGFSMELNKYGGSIHWEKTLTLSGFPGASGYTQEVDSMGFHATGAFTCTSSGWSYSAAPVTDAFITMHGIMTLYPPP